MAAAVDTVMSQWRDPEFALRLEQLRKWKTASPHRPLVVAFGSSRTQMGLAPAAMGFLDEPGSPIVYNFGYRAAHPLGAHLQFARMLEAGMMPEAVLIQLAAAEVMLAAPAERQLPPTWFPRFTLADIQRLAPHTANSLVFRSAWAKSHLMPWTNYREAIGSDLIPDWRVPAQRLEFTWEIMDEYGFAAAAIPHMTDAERAFKYEELHCVHARVFNSFTPGERTGAIFRQWLSECRADGIPVAFFWAPESPSCMSLYTPASRAAIAAYSKQLSEDLGVAVFPVPAHLEAADFVDAFHLRQGGAERYSRWLADTHLKPWLAKVLSREGSGR